MFCPLSCCIREDISLVFWIKKSISTTHENLRVRILLKKHVKFYETIISRYLNPRFSISVRTVVLSPAQYGTYRDIPTIYQGVPIVCPKRAERSPKILGCTNWYTSVMVEIRGIPIGTPW